jgi:hypothetical protein
VHASIMTFAGDPDDLCPRIDDLLAQVPADNVRLMLVLRRPDGVTLVDTCPSRDAYDRFRASGWLDGAIAEVGLPAPVIADHPVHVAIIDGAVISGRDIRLAAPA